MTTGDRTGKATTKLRMRMGPATESKKNTCTWQTPDMDPGKGRRFTSLETGTEVRVLEFWVYGAFLTIR